MLENVRIDIEYVSIKSLLIVESEHQIKSWWSTGSLTTFGDHYKHVGHVEKTPLKEAPERILK